MLSNRPIFGIDAQSSLNFDHFKFKRKTSIIWQKFPISGSKVAKNFRFEPLEFLTSCYEFRKSEPRRVENGVAYKKMCTTTRRHGRAA